MKQKGLQAGGMKETNGNILKYVVTWWQNKNNKFMEC